MRWRHGKAFQMAAAASVRGGAGGGAGSGGDRGLAGSSVAREAASGSEEKGPELREPGPQGGGAAWVPGPSF